MRAVTVTLNVVVERTVEASLALEMADWSVEMTATAEVALGILISMSTRVVPE